MADHEPSATRFYSIKDVMQRYQICERTVHNLLNSGELEGSLIARRWKFTEEALQRYERSKMRTEGKGARKKRAYHRKTA